MSDEGDGGGPGLAEWWQAGRPGEVRATEWTDQCWPPATAILIMGGRPGLPAALAAGNTKTG